VKRFKAWISRPLVYSIINFILAVGAWFFNATYQAFCQPVAWAAILILLFLLAFIAWPFIPERFRLVRMAAMMLQGIGVIICIYCIAFDPMLLVISSLLTLIGIGIFGVAPLIFLLQLLWRIKKCESITLRRSAVGGVLILSGFQLFFALQYRNLGVIINEIPPNSRTPKMLANKLPRNYMSERFAGTHFRYHTKPDYYDGWRPPLHDPFHVISRWIFPNVDNSNPGQRRLDLFDRIDLYQEMYPSTPAFVDCLCAPFNDDSKSYPRLPGR
jgi:hypothetical protein